MGKVQPLSRSEVDDALKGMKDWRLENDSLKAVFTFKDFKNAFDFMRKVAQIAEEMNHHPAWSNVYNKVTFALYTHDAGNKVSEKDVALARRVSGLLQAS
ncbi:MAG: 4a-hydroxytetrahydrobiopterin dehydratase [Alphaproteobacteria bacterium]|nr:4a-hydroxytetrahydrobiopterin dehydratase [Alphaproteobacteria bacterium]